MKRRDFLRSTGWFVVGAAFVGVPGAGCSDDDNTPPPDGMPQPDPVGTYAFPQGVASADPQASSVVVWTRVALKADLNAGFATVAVRLHISTDASFGTLVVDRTVSAAAAVDHTVRVLVTQLQPATTYYYRFVAGQDEISGRTRTAPERTADVPVNFAWVSCQDYTAGHYGAYRQMIVDDDARPEAERIHAVIHLGDMIYETRADVFQSAIDENFEPITLTNRDGSPRQIAAFPSGGGTRAEVNFAKTIDDYRHLYKTFFSDPDIQAARARWPFISIWDDHEFTDDCWQSQANYTNEQTADEGDQTRRMAASQAWFEFVPALLTGAGTVPGVTNNAKDFAFASVSDAAFVTANDDNFVAEPNNVAAVGAITIYRSLRFGKHVELVMTDERSYRSDHALHEELFALIGPPLLPTPRNVLPLPLINALDQGNTANNNNAPEKIVLSPFISIPNLRRASPVGTVLGKQQKAWWKDTMKKSDATWKLWGNEVTMMRITVPRLSREDPNTGPVDPADRVMTADSWDGYASERNELLGYLETENIKNVVVLSGDIHAAFAGTLKSNFDNAASATVACELVGPGITSNSLYSFLEFATHDPMLADLRPLVAVDATSKGGSKFTENANMLLKHGLVAAGTFAGAIANPNVPSVEVAIGAAVAASTDPNPHLKYIDTNAQGYGYVKVTGDQVVATINTINRPIQTPAANDPGPGHKRQATFTIPKDNPAGMTGPEITGTKPFPLL